MRQVLSYSVFSAYSRLNYDFYMSESCEEQIYVELLDQESFPVAVTPKYIVSYQRSSRPPKQALYSNDCLTPLISLLNYKLIMKTKGSLSSAIFAFIILMLLLVTTAKQKEEKRNFPRFIWTFWEGDIRVFTKLCFNNMKYYAQKSGWELTILSTKTFLEQLSEESRNLFIKIRDKGDYKTTKLADLIRCFILYQKGGIWLDSSSLLFAELSWLDSVEKQPFFYNKVSQQPQVIHFTYNIYYGGNKTVVYDEELRKDIYLLPGVENWIMFAKEKNEYFRDIISQFRSHVLERNQSETEIIDSYIAQGYSYDQQKNPYFFFGNFHLQTVLQSKQREIDNNPQRFDTKYAIDHYKIWNIKGEETVFKNIKLIHYRKYSLFFKKLFYKYDRNVIGDVRLMKFTGYEAILYSWFIYLSPYLICSGIIDPISKQSIAYEQALAMGAVDEELLTLKQLVESPGEVCKKMSSKGIYFAGAIMVILFAFFYLLNQCNSKVKVVKQH